MADDVLMGFDFGHKRTGVACGYPATGLATPVETVRSRRGRPDIDAISGIIDDFSPCMLVVGLPLHEDGEESNLSAAARAFARGLEKRFGLPVALHDERLTSVLADEDFREARKLRLAKRGSPTDSQAARHILLSYMRSTRPTTD